MHEWIVAVWAQNYNHSRGFISTTVSVDSRKLGFLNQITIKTIFVTTVRKKLFYYYYLI